MRLDVSDLERMYESPAAEVENLRLLIAECEDQS
jgi:hypothetical protein